MLLSAGEVVVVERVIGDDRLDSDRNVLNRLGILTRPNGTDHVRLELLGKYKAGRKGKNISSAIRAEVKSATDVGVLTQAEIAEITEISQSTVSLASRGLVGNRFAPVEPTSKVEEIKDRILEKTLDKITLAIDKITADGLDKSKPVELSTIAKNLSSVNDKLSMSKIRAIEGGARILIYAPSIKAENTYERVKVLSPIG